jgi:collagen type VII alpha
MAIYVDNLGDSNLPVTLTNPQEGEALVWDEEAGAFVNAPQSGSTEVIQDTVADMLEVDPDGTNVSLKLVSSYDDATGKLTFNVVADPGTGGGTGVSGIVVKENGATRGTATTLDFNGAAVSFASGTATITGLLDSIGIQDTGVNVGDVQNFDFHGFDLSVSGDTVTVMAPDLTGIISSIEVQQGGVVKGDVTKLNFSGATVGVAGDTATITITGGGGGGGGAVILDDLTDVVLSGVTSGQVLKFNGTNWVNAADSTGTTITSLDDIGDVDLTGAASGLILGYDGTKWIPVSNSGSTGPTGPQGPAGPAGATVSSASVSGGTLTLTLSDGSNVTVSGSVAGPQGAQGATGATGATGPAGASVTAATVSVTGRLLITLSSGTVVDAGNVAGISSATVNGSGDLILTKQDGTTVNAGSVIGPAGPQGIQGATGATGATGPQGVSVNNAIVDGSGNLVVYTDDGNSFNAGSVVGPTGPTGAQGPAGEYITSATVDGSGNLQITTSDSNVINAGSVIGPQGATGATGPQGPAATITVGTVTTGAEGSSVIVTNSGTSGAAVLDFTIPKGDTGPAFSLNSVSGSAEVYGITSTTVPGYDLEVDTANKWRTPRSLSLSGKVTGLTTGIDGSGNISITTSLSGVTTDDVTEGTNQYHTTARARGSVSANTLSGITYNSTTGVFSLSSIPTGSLAASNITINGTSITLGGSGTITTSNITEGTNQYFTNARADARADVRIAASSINALQDVDTATTLPTSGQALVWDGTVWKPGTVAGGGGGGISTVNGYSTSTVTLVTDDIAEDGSPTNKWFTDARARAAISAGGNLSYNSTTGVMSYTTPTTDGVTEGSTNLYYTTARFDTRLGQSNLSQLNDVADTAATSGQVLAWNSSTSKWTPSSSAGGGGTALERLAVQVDYDASGNLTSVTVLNGSGSATITASSSSTAEVEFTLTGFSAPPISTVVYGYQRASNVYAMRHVDNATWTTKKFAAGGTAGSPTMWSGWDPTVHKLTLTLTRAVSLASAGVGQTTHCVVQITGVA